MEMADFQWPVDPKFRTAVLWSLSWETEKVC